MKRILSAIAAVILALCSELAPALATINPVYNIAYNGPGQPGVGKVVSGTVTFGSADTYTTGGFIILPSQLGCSVAVTSVNYNSPLSSFDVAESIVAGSATIKFVVPMNGTSNVTAAATTKTVTIPTGFTANDVLTVNSAIYVQLDDAATGGGGTGTWAVTDAVASVKYASASTFTLTVIAAAPTNNGNFVWQIPGINMELASGTAIASLVMPFTATCV
jgi:hypothetical protein